MRVALLTAGYPPGRFSQVRPQSFVQALIAAGHTVCVLTRPWVGTEASPNDRQPGYPTVPSWGEVAGTPVLSLPLPAPVQGRWREWRSRWLGLLRGQFDRQANFVAPQRATVLAELRRWQPELIVASSPPEALLVEAAGLARALGVPFVLDIRDYWNWHEELLTQPPTGLAARLRHALYHHHLGPVLRRAAGVGVVNPGIRQRLLDQVPGLAPSQVVVVPNGYERATLRPQPAEPYPVFTVAYVGSLYPEQLNPLWLKGFVAFVQHVGAEKTHFQFVGAAQYPQVAAALRRALPSAALTVTGRVPRTEALEVICRAHVLFYPAWAGYHSIYPGKVYDYLIAHRPVLVAPSVPDLWAHLAPTGLVTPADNETEVLAALTGWYRTWQATGTVVQQGNQGYIESFAREAIAEGWVTWLEGLSTPAPGA